MIISEPEMLDERCHVVGPLLRGVPVLGMYGLPGASLVRQDDVVAVGEALYQFSPAPPDGAVSSPDKATCARAPTPQRQLRTHRRPLERPELGAQTSIATGQPGMEPPGRQPTGCQVLRATGHNAPIAEARGALHPATKLQNNLIRESRPLLDRAANSIQAVHVRRRAGQLPSADVTTGVVSSSWMPSGSSKGSTSMPNDARRVIAPCVTPCSSNSRTACSRRWRVATLKLR
jgi:hypothetical protein